MMHTGRSLRWVVAIMVISMLRSSHGSCSTKSLLLQYEAGGRRLVARKVERAGDPPDSIGSVILDSSASEAEAPGDGEDGHSSPEKSSAAPLKALPDFLPVKLPSFPWWALPIPSQAALPWSDPQAGIPHFPILDNLFLLLKVAESCFNCTFFLSVDTPLLLGAAAEAAASRALDLSPANLRLLYYQVVPFHLPFAAISPLPLAFRIPSLLNGSYLLVTRSSSSFPRDNFVSLNYQRLLAPDLFVSDSMVVHGISGFLAPFTLAIPF